MHTKKTGDVARTILALNAASSICGAVTVAKDWEILAEALQTHCSMRELQTLEATLKEVYRKIIVGNGNRVVDIEEP